jgi:hypothetical protein
MVGFDERLPRQLRPQHRKLISDDGIELIIVPRLSDFLLISHPLGVIPKSISSYLCCFKTLEATVALT